MRSVAFIHLDLGIGGAENLVVNAAKGLQEAGYSVKMFTAHHDPARAFKETTDGTLSVCFLLVNVRLLLGFRIRLMDPTSDFREVYDSHVHAENVVGLYHDLLPRSYR
jgi:hypothetical protein